MKPDQVDTENLLNELFAGDVFETFQNVGIHDHISGANPGRY
jgi:hypothetical protein